MNDVVYRQDVLDISMKYCSDDDGSCSEPHTDLREMLDEIENLPSAQHRPCCYLDSPCPYQNEEIKVAQNDELSIAKNLVSNYSPQVLEIALKYANHLVVYGIDIAEKHETVVQQEEMCSRAYTKGRHDEREEKRCIDCEAFNKTQLLVPQAQQKWIPCEKKMPKAEEKVWIQTQSGKACFAMYEDGTISENDSKWSWYDIEYSSWDEDEDCGIIPEGWWEFTQFHPDCEFDCPVDEKVVAWMHLPEPYKEGENG